MTGAGKAYLRTREEYFWRLFGPPRTIALFPFALVLTFGAFSLGWRRITSFLCFPLSLR